MDKREKLLINMWRKMKDIENPSILTIIKCQNVLWHISVIVFLCIGAYVFTQFGFYNYISGFYLAGVLALIARLFQIKRDWKYIRRHLNWEAVFSHDKNT